jgi:PiT family inorganic phosphate transporter
VARSSTSTPPQGFAAETAGATILYVAGLGFGAPISTRHTITSTIMGVGATKRLSAVRWGMAKNIVTGWLRTFPGAGLVAAVVYALTIPFQQH